MKYSYPTSRSLIFGLLLLFTLGSAAFAQISTTGRLTGTVTDPQGSVVPNAQVTVKGSQAEGQFNAVTNKDGSWTLPSIPSGLYTVTVTASGFKSTIVKDVKVDVGLPATVNAALEIGQVGDQVIVTGGGEVLQTASANISSTITGKQIHELPFSTRDAMQLVIVMPGVQTPGTSRTSSVNGLPKSSLNITIDGANVQDNLLKSSDGFFTDIQPKSDAVEEVTVSTATPGAESAGGGAVQIKFVTKQGSNDFHGGLFWQHRNNALNANYFFNNIDGLPRDRILLNQFGGNIGGPIIIPKIFNGRDKAFFFINMEEFRLPQTHNVARTVLTNTAQQGIFTYKDSGGAIITRNLYQLAAAGNATLPGTIRAYPTTVDPTIAKTFPLINASLAQGVITSRITSNNDYNRLNLAFQDPGNNMRHFPTIRLDFNITSNHHVEFIHNYQNYFANPDGVNSIFSIYPGTGSVLGGDGSTGSVYRNSFSYVFAERWTIKNNLVNEVRFTSSGNGTSNFRREFSADQFKLFNGYNVVDGPTYTSGFRTYTSNSRRNTPVKSINDNLTWLKGNHTINFGGSYDRVSSWTSDIGSALVPTVTLNIAAGDPVNTGTTSIFTAGNFPGSSAAQRTEAAALYALLTGRISSTARNAALDETTRKYAFSNTIVRSHEYAIGLYGQDSWKIKPNLTLTGGLRWEFDPAPTNDNNVYTRTTPEGLFGVSGFGNLFKPGVYSNPVITQYRLLEPGEKGFPNNYHDFAPSLGFAWSPSFKSGILSRVFGDNGQTVLRGGYSIAYVREGFGTFTSIFGGNDGAAVAVGTSPGNNPAEFGQAGSRLLRDSTYPFLPFPAATFPFTAGQGRPLNDFDPNLRPGYTQSWTFGIQRELTKDTALEVRYVGNHGTRLWRQIELSDVNIFENGFINEFKIAQENLRIARLTNPTSTNFGNQGLAGQRDIPIIQTALATTNDTTFATTISRGEAGRLASNIAQDLTRMNRLTSSTALASIIKPITLADPNNPGQNITLSNFFIVNPRAPSQVFYMTNGADSNYNALQIELRRRMSKGLLVQGSYVWAKAITNAFANSSGANSQPTTLRDPGQDKAVTPRDMRHAVKFDYIYDLPIGPGRHFLSGGPSVVRKVLEGWQLGGVARIQSGAPTLITSGRLTVNNRESGVVLRNITRNQLQEMVKVRKEVVCDTPGVQSTCRGLVYYLPQDIINNTLAAFELGGTLDPTKPYIGPPTTAGEFGSILYLYGPWTSRFDFNLMKRTKITEKFNFEFRAQFLNAFNQSAITIRGPGTDASTSAIGAAFGQTRNAFRDFSVSGTNDPGGRLIEFQLRLNF